MTALLDPLPIDFLKYRPQMLMLGGMAHFGLDEKEKAKPYLEAIRVRTTATSPAAKLLAQIYISEGNVDRAIGTLDTYLKGQPGDGQAIRLLASAHMSKGRYARATQLMQDALRSQRHTPGMRSLLGMSLIGGGKFGNAVSELEDALLAQGSGADRRAGTALAAIYMQSGQGGKAVKVAERPAAGAKAPYGSADPGRQCPGPAAGRHRRRPQGVRAGR